MHTAPCPISNEFSVRADNAPPASGGGRAEKFLWESVQDQKTLSLSRGRRPGHAMCHLLDRFMRDYCPLVRINLVVTH